MDRERLVKYAELTAISGVGLQKGQDVVISAEVDQEEFVGILTEACYRLGARKVSVEWSSQIVDRVRFMNTDKEVLCEVQPETIAKWKKYSENIPVFIHIDSEDPFGFDGVDTDKISAAQQARRKAIKQYKDIVDEDNQWCVICAPGRAWAKRMYPELTEAEAIDRLWEDFLEIGRANGEDPVSDWKKHDEDLKEKCRIINGLKPEKIHYFAPNGTDITIGLMERSMFCAGSEENRSGVSFLANIPTEECFVSPKKGEAEGIVYSTKPFAYFGQTIDDFWIRFHEGKACEWHANVNNDLLSSLLTFDEGSSYLGECAIVPDSSPISRTGKVFNSILIDENAACHIALGNGYDTTIEGYQDLSVSECREMGLNESMLHADFMIGYGEMNIDLICRDGKEVAIFRNGEWVI